MIRLLIATGTRFYRDGLAEVLPSTGTIDVIATASDWAEVLHGTAAAKPEVVLVDAALVPYRECLEQLKATSALTKVVVIALPPSVEHAVEWVEAGADSYVPRDASVDELRAAVEGISRGQVRCPPEVTARLIGRVAALSRLLSGATDSGRRLPLTPREWQVAELIAAGLSNKGISRRLGIRMATTKNHVHNILSKLSLQRRTQVALWLHRQAGAGAAD